MSEATEVTYTVRSIWEGTILAETKHLDDHAANDCFEQSKKFYLNAPFSDSASGVTVQMFRESDQGIEREITFD